LIFIITISLIIKRTSSTKSISKKPDIPKGVKVGDFIVARYTSSSWAPIWEDWHHAALVTHLDPLTIIEAVGSEADAKNPGPTVRVFKKTPWWYTDAEDIVKIKWLRPVFPDQIHVVMPNAKGEKPALSPTKARSLTVRYALDQIGEDYKLSIKAKREYSATKWDEEEWYCSLLVYKAFSRTIGLYLETYPIPGFFVTPGDLVDSKNSEAYHLWINEKYDKPYPGKIIDPNILA
jgi:hypothetical protein